MTAVQELAVDLRGMSREDWLELRKTGIGSSDAAASVGLSPYATELQFYREKRGEVPPADLSKNKAVKWGTLLEPVIRDDFTERTGRVVHRVHQMLRHPKHPFMLANLDGRIVGERTVHEIKTVGFWGAQRKEDWGEEGSDFVPQVHHVQVQHQLAVTGYERGVLTVLIAGQDERDYNIPRDEPLIDWLIEREAKMWERIQKGDPPPPTSIDDVKGLFPAATVDRAIMADAQIAALVGDIQFAQAQAKEIDEQIDALKMRVMEFMGSADTLMFCGQPITTWRNRPSTSLDTKRLKTERPDVYEEYARRNTTRTFKVLEAE